jgi:hypothetical protein
MTKWGGLPFGSRGHHRADFHLRIVADDPINESFHPVSALSKRQGVKCWVQALTQRLNSLGPDRNLDVLLCLGVELPQWLR